jgi:hypothetical protein
MAVLSSQPQRRTWEPRTTTRTAMRGASASVRRAGRVTRACTGSAPAAAAVAPVPHSFLTSSHVGRVDCTARVKAKGDIGKSLQSCSILLELR